MKPARNILIALVLVPSLVLAVISGLLIGVADDAFYRGTLIRIVQRWTGGSLKISGDFSFQPGLVSSLTADGVEFESEDHSVRFEIGRIQAHVDLVQLRHRQLWLKSLVAIDARIRVLNLVDRPIDTDDLFSMNLVPVLESVFVKSLHLSYPRPDGPRVDFFQDLLRIESGADKRLNISGEGRINSHPLVIQGHTGSLDQFTARGGNFAIDLQIRFPRSLFSVTGAIRQPSTSKRVDLTISGHMEELKLLTDLVRSGAPPLGRLQMNATVGGTLDAPELGDIELSAGNETDFRLHVYRPAPESGHKRPGAMFAISISKPEILAWLMPDNSFGIQSLDITSHGRYKEPAYEFDRTRIRLDGRHRLEISLDGAVALQPMMNGLRVNRLKMNAKWSIPEFSRVLPFEAQLPGTLSGHAGLSGSSERGFRADQLEAVLRKPDKINLKASGNVSVLESDTDMNIRVHGSVTDTATLRWLLPERWHVIRKIDLDTLVRTENQEISLNELKLNAISVENWNTDLAGEVRLALASPGFKLVASSLDIRTRAPDKEAFRLFDTGRLPVLAPVRASARLKLFPSGFEVENIDLEMGKAPLTANLHGHLRGTRLMKRPQFENMNLGLKIESINGDTVGIFGRGTPSRLSPYTLSGQLSGNSRSLKLITETRFSGSHIKTDLRFSGFFQRLNVSGSVSAPVLSIADLGLTPVASSAQQTGSAAWLFSNRKLPFNGLFASDLNLTMRAERLEIGNMHLRNLNLGLRSRNGQASIRGLEFVLGGGKVSARGNIRAGSMPAVDLDFQTGGINLATAFPRESGDAPVKGRLYASGSLQSAGNTPAQLLSRLDGRLNLAMENARVEEAHFNLLALKVIRWLFKEYDDDDHSSTIDCAAVGLDFTRGRGHSQDLFLDSPQLLAKGEGTLDLASRHVNFLLRTSPRNSLLPSGLPIRVSGNLFDPQIEAIPVRAAVATYADLMTHPVDIPRKTIDYLKTWVGLNDAEKHRCLEIRSVR